MSRHNYNHGGDPRWRLDAGEAAPRRATPGRYRVVAEDRKFYGDDWVVEEYVQFEDAVDCADSHTEPTLPLYVYDDQARVVHNPVGLTPFRYERDGGGPYIDPPDRSDS